MSSKCLDQTRRLSFTFLFVKTVGISIIHNPLHWLNVYGFVPPFKKGKGIFFFYIANYYWNPELQKMYLKNRTHHKTKQMSCHQLFFWSWQRHSPKFVTSIKLYELAFQNIFFYRLYNYAFKEIFWCLNKCIHSSMHWVANLFLYWVLTFCHIFTEIFTFNLMYQVYIEIKPYFNQNLFDSFKFSVLFNYILPYYIRALHFLILNLCFLNSKYSLRQYYS